MSDADLLQQYADAGSQTAFATLVNRHLDLVYSAARRQVRSSALADEVAQAVFLDLARHASTLKPGQPLVAWLYLVTRRTAIDVVRRETRRQAREQASAEIAAMKSDSAAWSELEPLLDEAMAALDDADRAAVLLRFFENKSLRDVGTTLGTSENAAQKRIARALEQLRQLFVRRGITVAAAGLAGELSAHAIQSAPAGLGSAILSKAASSGAAIFPAAAKTIAMTVTQKTIGLAALAAALALGLYEGRRAWRLHRAIEAGDAQVHALTNEADRLRRERDAARRDLLAYRSAAAPAAVSDDPLTATGAAWLARVERLRQIFAEHPEWRIPEMQLLTDEDWFYYSQARILEPGESAPLNVPYRELRYVLEGLRTKAKERFGEQLLGAMKSYVETNAHQLPTDLLQLSRYFRSPVDPAIFQRYDFQSGNGRMEAIERAASAPDPAQLLAIGCDFSGHRPHSWTRHTSAK
jgi:RNA polymerase sigma factor (sigma-70 family)